MRTGILNTETDDRKMHLLYVTLFKDRPTGIWNVMLCRTYKDPEPLTKMKDAACSFASCETGHHIKKYDIRAD